jgi:predicted O-linked N-acetylglucosamine transferase (SPINDLY family)
MGVPVLTLKGGRYVSRVGESILNNIGMPEFIAENKQDYVKKAKEFASDINALLDIRTNLRGRALKSPLFDGERFAKNFEDAIEWMWKKYLDNNSATE